MALRGGNDPFPGAATLNENVFSWLVYYGALGFAAFALCSVGLLSLPGKSVADCAALTNLAQSPTDWTAGTGGSPATFAPPTWTTAAARLAACHANPHCAKCVSTTPGLTNGGAYTGLLQICVAGIAFPFVYWALVIVVANLFAASSGFRPEVSPSAANLVFY